MRRRAVTLALMAVVLSGCAESAGPPIGSTVEPKSGPAATADVTTSTASGHSSGGGTSNVPDFHQQHVYADGVRVEVTKIVHARLTKGDVQSQEMKAKVGDHYVDFTVRLANTTKENLPITTDDSVTYGPDGEEAEEIYLGAAAGDITSAVLPGKSRSLHLQYIIPKNQQDDVLLEFFFNKKYEWAVFAGSVY